MSQRIIIFDGPDMCGKTEMAQALSARLSIPYFKNENEWAFFEEDPSYFKNAVTYGDPYFASYLRQTGASVIMDRWYPSEWVYSQVFGRETNADALTVVDEWMAQLGAVIIIPWRNSYDGLKDQFKSVTAKKMAEIEAVYKAFNAWTNCRVFWLNVDDENLDRELDEIMEFLEG
jgi:thymidylate kinase